MKAWSLPGLGIFLAAAVGCAGFFATDELPMDCRTLGCPAGEVCTWGGGRGGGKAYCEEFAPFLETKEAEAECHEDEACPEGQLCIAQAPAAPGICQPGCRVGEDGCAGSTFCIGPPNARPGELGECLTSDIPPCRVGDGSCNTGYVCTGISNNRFNMPGRCKKDTLGSPCNTDGDCSWGSVCETRGGQKTCVPGERLGAEVVATLRSFQLRQNGNLLVPVQVNAQEINLSPSFASEDAATPTEVRVVTQGPGAQQRLELKVGTVPACASTPALCEGEVCTWTCVLPASWAGAGEPRWVDFHLALGGAAKQAYVWRYLVAPLPEVVFEVVDGALLGGPLRVCATAPSVRVPPYSFQPQPVQLDIENMHAGAREIPLAWGPLERVSEARVCREAGLPPSLRAGQVHMAVRAQLRGAAGFASQSLRLSLVRMECSRNLGLVAELVKQPLVLANRRLVFGAGVHLYAFDTTLCASAFGPLQTGEVQGPMVALGNSGRVALALGHGGVPPRNTPRLALLNTAGALPTFVYENAARDCVPGSGGTAAASVFDTGLSLLTMGKTNGEDDADNHHVWRFSAPANSGAATRLLAYAAHESANSSVRCVGTSVATGYAFLVPTLQTADGTLVGIFGLSNAASFFKRGWGLNPSTWAWTSLLDRTSIANPDRRPPYWAAASGNDIWTKNALSRSPAAIGAGNRVYDVFHDAALGGLRLRHFPLEGASSVNTVVSEVVFGHAPVGSPLLGEPLEGEGAEVYVVTSNGGVFVLDAQTLEHLWSGLLGFAVSPAAQPVLTSNADGSGTLWVVGTRGEIRGLQVGSRGLSRMAKWAKAFKDNCNTSSQFIALQGCY